MKSKSCFGWGNNAGSADPVDGNGSWGGGVLELRKFVALNGVDGLELNEDIG